MQTNFTETQLQDPQVAASEAILRSCVHCGFCTATCPTYLTLGDELDSPRGRIYLIKDMLENDRAADEKTTLHIDRCLSCLACMTTCPSGVHYMHLVDHARNHIENTYQRPLLDRLQRWLLSFILPYPGRFRFAVTAAKFAKPFGFLLKPFPRFKPAVAMLKLAPGTLPKARRMDLIPKLAEPKGRVAILGGCAQPVLNPRINEATVDLLARFGIEVVQDKNNQCCGALVHHMGKEAQAHVAAKSNIDRWWAAIENGGLDAIIITTSGCGTTIKDYGFMLRNDPEYAEKAAAISALAKDISEYLIDLDLPTSEVGQTMTVAYHSACSMQHGQKITNEPKRLLAGAGFKVVDIPEGHLCCGSAGTYNILQSDIAEQLKSRKLKNIEKTKPDLVAAGNIGCMTQLASGLNVPIVHTVELLNWAYGGDKPDSLTD